MTTRQIHDSLDLLGYGPISNDGALGPATQEAQARLICGPRRTAKEER